MQILELVGEQVRKQIVSELERVGLMFRIFWRIKAEDSVKAKILKKNYASNGKLMQDSIGFRIAVYFMDDAPLVISILKKMFDVDNEEIDFSDEETFKPVRTNIVCRLSKEPLSLFKSSSYSSSGFIDATFEIQVRTVLSEGWHEVEHDLRYKSKQDWQENIDLSRALNGIYASLETSEWSMLKLFQEMAYRNYKEAKWGSMIRNKFRIRTNNKEINPSLISIFSEKSEIAKQVFRVDRTELMSRIIASRISVPISADNIVFMVNHIFIHDVDISLIASPHMTDELENYLS